MRNPGGLWLARPAPSSTGLRVAIGEKLDLALNHGGVMYGLLRSIE
jgi:hypothetical protein